MNDRPRFDALCPAKDPILRQQGQSPREPQLLQDSFDFIQYGGAAEDPPRSPPRGLDHPFRGTAQDGLRHVNVGVEENLHAG